MGKAPAFQFFVKDWLSDPQLKMASHTTKGIWIDSLCFMWESATRGKLYGTPTQFVKMLGCSLDEFSLFLKEAIDLKFCDVEVSDSVTFPLHVTQCNILVTIKNRRMYREQKDRDLTRKRVQKYREKKPGNAGCNAPVTPPSPFPSPSPLGFTEVKPAEADPQNNKKSDHFKDKIPESQHDILVNLAQKILTLPAKNGKPYNPFEFIQRKTNKNYHPESIIYTFRQLIGMWPEVKSPWSWSETVCNKKNATWNEHESARASQEFKEGLERASPDIKYLLAGIG